MRKLAPICILLFLAAPCALAGGEEVRAYSRLEDFNKFEFKSLVLDDSGTWRLGRHWRTVPVGDGEYLSDMVADEQSLLIAAGGEQGQLFLVDRAKKNVQTIYSGEGTWINCLASLGRSRWLAGTGPEGKVWLIEDEEPAVLFDTDCEFILDLQAGEDAVWAAGDNGAVYRYDFKSGTTSVLARIPDEAVSCLALGKEDELLAGSSGQGYLFSISEDGDLLLLADFEEEEVQHVLVAEDGMIFAATSRAGTDCTENCARVFRLTTSGLIEEMLVMDAPYVGGILPTEDQGLWVSSGKPGELDLLTGPYTGSVHSFLADTYFGGLIDDGDGLWVLQAKPPAVHHLDGEARRGSLTSTVLDLEKTCRVGAIRVEGQRDRKAGIEMEMRAGQGPDPAIGWSDWTACPREGRAWRADLPAARYFQWRLHLEGGQRSQPTVSRVALHFLPLNRPPLLAGLEVLRPTDQLFLSSMDLSGRTLTQVMDNGALVQYQSQSPPSLAQEQDARFMVGLRSLTWDWFDPDGDLLTATIEIRREGDLAWQLLEDKWHDSIYTWDSRGWEDGHYRFRVKATDSASNSEDSSLGVSAVSELVLLDSKAPVFDLDFSPHPSRRINVRGTVRDEGGGIVARLERRFGEGDWVRMASADGFMDRPAIDLNRTIDLPIDARYIELRAGDECGNWSYLKQDLTRLR